MGVVEEEEGDEEGGNEEEREGEGEAGLLTHTLVEVVIAASWNSL